ncbi:hypothetical protein [Streptomyces sp. NRRL S-378]|uniref:hypothetical protein n=1 Tax=Streptomyces sp. NRRL S-378 TaxID=1463904 RepID=UPI000A92B1AF|nr:hypothetical protein [Streptomyces sp. NRRL S-378]
MTTRQRLVVAHVAAFVVLALLLGFTVAACDDQPASSTGVELDIDRPKARKTAKPAAPKPAAPKPPAAKAPSTRKR